MGKINVLPTQVAELIAAGEVVDRPASIVKELVENALDAGAARISVEIRRGGITYLRVTDDGCGMEKEDIPLAFVRHATSKVLTALDLESIMTLGFRGEALPSIAAVSRLTVTTRTAAQPEGYVYRIDGENPPALRETGCAVGTSIEVRDVFYNTPARMKFLKQDVAEGNAVASLMDRLALANPAVAFELVRDSKRVLQTPGDGDLLSAVRIVCGAQTSGAMTPVSFSDGGVGVTGFISLPSVSRASRALQVFFVNSRFVRSKTCAGALEEAYKNRLMSGRFPSCVLNLQLDASLVDVNVHPAKLEVRFSGERAVYNAVYAACKEALARAERQPIPPTGAIHLLSLKDFNHADSQIRFGAAPDIAAERTTQAPLHGRIQASAAAIEPLILKDTTGSAPDLRQAAPQRIEPPASLRFARRGLPDIEREDTPALSVRAGAASHGAISCAAPPAHAAGESGYSEALTETHGKDNTLHQKAVRNVDDVQDARDESEDFLPWRIIGEAFDTYILVEQAGRLLLIDKHAAHERYIYNSIRRLNENQDRQVLLSPQAVTLSRDEYFALTEHPQALASLGIVAEDFGEGTFLIREVPMLFDGFSLPELLGETAARLMAQKAGLSPSALDELLYSVSCRAAVMAGKRSAPIEQERLVEMVLGPQRIRHCPHGRPAVVALTRREIEKLFGRLG